MHARQAVDFLRRRYANAILRDDVQTAGRLRDQLDGLMNRGEGTCAGGAELSERVASPVAPGRQDLFALLASISGRVP
ncbi:MAG: hypothetical protein ACREH3_05665 [Geminicoccales bacterium]